MYPWHLQMVYCKVGILLKMVSYKVMKIENENGQLQSADNCKWQWKVEDTYVGNIIYSLFLHFFFILCLNVLYHSLITIGLITLNIFCVDFCIQSLSLFVHLTTVMVVLIHICIFHYIYLLHIYYIIIAYF